MTKLEDLNKDIKECKRCRLCETRINTLCGEGNSSSKLMLVAQAPGKQENKEGRMFIGPSGKKLDELLAEVGIARNELYMTNLIKCMLPKYRKPKQDEIEICSQYLDKEIELINPQIITPLGYYATKYIFEKYLPGACLPNRQGLQAGNISAPNTKSEFSTVYGKIFLPARHLTGGTQDRKILPLQHPVALLYNDSIREEMIKNYRKMKILTVECKWFPVCPLKRFYEEGKIDKKWIELYCRGDWENCVRYWMEEEGKPHSDYMLPDGSIAERLCN
jgi:uracil-DNA glycosylase family 4